MITVETSFSLLDMPMKYDHGNRHSQGGGGEKREVGSVKDVGVPILSVVQRA